MTTPVPFNPQQLNFFVPPSESLILETRSIQAPVADFIRAHTTNAAFTIHLEVWREVLAVPPPQPVGGGGGKTPFAKVARPIRVLQWEMVDESDGTTPLSVEVGDILAAQVRANAPGSDQVTSAQLIVVGTNWMTVPIQLDLHVSEVKTQLDPPTYLRAGSYAPFGGDVILTYGDQADVSYTLFQASALQGTVHLLPERLTTYPTPLTKQNPKGSLDSGTTQQQIMLTADATAPVGGLIHCSWSKHPLAGKSFATCPTR